MDTRIIDVDLGERSYPIYIGRGLLGTVDDCLPEDVAGRKIFIVTDKNVQPYAQRLKAALVQLEAAAVEIHILPSGEKTKSFAYLERVQDWLLSQGVHRSSLIIALGGGVIGDLVGFAAATVLRGVPFVQIPTSLLAQVDSSVGGKTGINTAQGKNLIGAFYQPIGVIADVETLKTLPPRQILAGYAEVVKYGLIGDYGFFEWLEDNGRDVIALDPYALAQAIEVSCRAKARIVQADEREGGMRALLNLGHTFGHALEAGAGYSDLLLHGEAVSIGMVMAYDLSVRMGLCDRDDLIRMRKHLSDLALPVSIPKKLKTNADDLIESMAKDKKATENGMTFILASGIGEAHIATDVKDKMLRGLLNDYLEEKEV